MKTPASLPGLNPPLLLILYSLLALAPLLIAYALDLPPRPFMDELSSGLALVGFAMLLLEFVLSGRFKTASGKIGIDITMRFHQLMARSLLVFILIHPFLYTIPITYSLPWDTSGELSLGITRPSFITGLLAWLGLPLLVLWAMFMRDFAYRYEVWRVCHGVGAVLIALLGLHHALVAGRYSGHEALAIFWWAMVGMALLTLAQVYVLGPLRQLRHPYKVVSNQSIGLNTWELVIEPQTFGKSSTPEDALDFLPGQFVWLTLQKSPFAVREHPFSISSAPAQRPRIGFTIKEMGDFTNTIGTIPVGTVAYLDGPHGHMVLEGRSEPGLVLIAGGSGIAPIMSMLRQLQATHDARPLKLIYGNRVPEQILYKNELDAMTAQLNLAIDYFLGEPPSGWTGKTGLLDTDNLRQCLSDENIRHWLYVVCGPSPMIDSVEQSLVNLGIPLRQILSEKFTQL